MNHQLSCIIVDDDAFSRETLEDLLDEFQNIKILKSLDESAMAIKYLATLKPNIAFLDINMPKKDGLSVLNEINDLGIECKVVFVTSYEEYLMDALKKNAFDYLLKPVKKKDLEEVLARYSDNKLPYTNKPSQKEETSSENKIVIQNAHGTLIFEAPQVAYIEADGCYTCLHLTNKKNETISKNIGRIEGIFTQKNFFKISRSIIINTNYLQRIDRLKKTVHLAYNSTQVALKASRNQLYDLESFIHNR